MERSARFSPCRRYRYSLWRTWRGLLPYEAKYAMFIGLNPSTADEIKDDPTIRRCIAYAQTWGYGGLCMVNLFAFRATSPADMMAADDPIGPDNDQTLRDLSGAAGAVIAAWGVHGTYRGRDVQVRAMLGALHYLRLTKGGIPAHPLYLPKTLRPVRWV